MSLTSLITTFTSFVNRKSVGRALGMLPTILTQLRTQGGGVAVMPEITVVGTLILPRLNQADIPRPVVRFPSNEVIEAYGPWFRSFTLRDEPNVTEMTFDDAEGATGITIDNCNDLVEFSAPELMIVTGDFDIEGCNDLEVINVPSLVALSSDLRIDTNDSLVELSLPSLIQVSFYFTVSDNPDFTTLSVPVLEYIGDTLEISYMGSITSLAFPALKRYDYSSIHGCDSLASLSFPVIEHIGNFSCTLSALTTLNFGSSIKRINAFEIYDSLLDEEAVDDILAMLVSLDGTAGTTLFDGNVLLGGETAIPSMDGMANVAILEGRGCSVSVNTP